MAEEQGTQISRWKEELEWMWKTFRDHPVKTIFLGAIGSLVASLFLFSLGNAPWQNDMTDAQIAELTLQVNKLRDDLEEVQHDNSQKLGKIDLQDLEVNRRLSDLEKQEFSIRLIEQRLGMTLPALTRRTEDLRDRVIRLETGSAEDRDLNGLERRFETTLGSIRVELGDVGRKAEWLEQAMERLRSLHQEAHERLASDADVESLRRQIEELVSSISEQDSAYHGTVQDLRRRIGVLEQSSMPIVGLTVLPVTPDLPDGKVASPDVELPVPTATARGAAADSVASCDLPVDPLLLGKAVRAPEVQRSVKPVDPKSHPPILQNLQVDVCLTVAADGTVREAWLVEGQDVHRSFQLEAENAGRRWVFEPARWRGEAVEWRKKVRFVFHP